MTGCSVPLSFKAELLGELHRIMEFWCAEMPDEEHGGFFGELTFSGVPVPKADKGIILNARILWAFSAAFNESGTTRYLNMAQRAYQYLICHFEDKLYGGYYWKTDYTGNPIENRKQTYAQAFVIYAFSEYYKASHQREVLDRAVSIFHLLEEHAKDGEHSGYWEALGREWTEIPDVRLSDKDLNEKKSLNTHLHVLEAYTALYKAEPNPVIEQSLKELLTLFPLHFVNTEGHLNLFFNEQWQQKSSVISFGHDIETSWLLMEAADALGSPTLKETIEGLSLKMALTFMQEGLSPQGGVLNERNPETGKTDADAHWWVQIEAMVGLVRAFQRTGNTQYMEAAITVWEYVKKYFLDLQHGEWYWLIRPDGTADTSQMKAGFWKCPYHNARGCIELQKTL